MDFLVNLVLFCIGFYVLIRGAALLVRGASSIARIFQLSTWFIGMIIVGIGTSIPEFAITVASVFEGNSIGLATVVGSTTFSVLFIVGLAAFFMPLQFEREWIVRDLPIFLFSMVLIMVVSFTSLIGGYELNTITRSEGAVLTVMCMLWIYYMLHRTGASDADGVDEQVFSWAVSVLYTLAGFIGVFVGGKWVVDGATSIALLTGVSPELVGFTVLSIGSSLPELTISLVAIQKRQMSLGIGTIIGSNVFDFFGIFGVVALVMPIAVTPTMQFDILFALASSLLLLSLTLVGDQKYTISRGEGVVFILLYVAYLLFLVLRG